MLAVLGLRDPWMHLVDLARPTSRPRRVLTSTRRTRRRSSAPLSLGETTHGRQCIFGRERTRQAPQAEIESLSVMADGPSP